MRQLRRDPGLVKEPVERLVGQRAFAGDFQGDDAIQLRVAGFPHGAEAPHPDTFDQLEVGDGRHRLRPQRLVSFSRHIKLGVTGRTHEAGQLAVRRNLDRTPAARTMNPQMARTRLARLRGLGSGKRDPVGERGPVGLGTAAAPRKVRQGFAFNRPTIRRPIEGKRPFWIV